MKTDYANEWKNKPRVTPRKSIGKSLACWCYFGIAVVWSSFVLLLLLELTA